MVNFLEDKESEFANEKYFSEEQNIICFAHES